MAHATWTDSRNITRGPEHSSNHIWSRGKYRGDILVDKAATKIMASVLESLICSKASDTTFRRKVMGSTLLTDRRSDAQKKAEGNESASFCRSDVMTMTVIKATFGRLPGDGVDRICTFSLSLFSIPFSHPPHPPLSLSFCAHSLSNPPFPTPTPLILR